MTTESSHRTRRVERVRHELRIRQLTVSRVAPVGPGFVAVTLTGDDLVGFPSVGFDDHVKVLFDENTRRDYTPRHYDAERNELTIEFVLHGHGPATEWARQARPGQMLTVGGPRGSMVVPTDFDWHLLAGDASALPALHRRLDELPSGSRALAIVQVDDPRDERRFDTQADLQVQWVRDADAWLAALRDLTLPEGEGFAWCAGHALTMAQARVVLLNHHRHPLEAMRVSAYWKAGATGFHENL